MDDLVHCKGVVKRKRRVGSGCSNPLFVKWVQELRDDAKERGLKSHHSYTKAINSLNKYPLPLRSGEEAKILDYIGDKLAKVLDKKLSEHKSASESDDMPSARALSTAKVSPIPQRSCKSKKRKVVEENFSSPAGKPKKLKEREYIPAYESGPYALIIALYRAQEKPSWRGFLHKAELIADAQPLSADSFTVPDAGSYYTAWSSISSILKKGLVRKISHPPKFSLTERGEEMALKLIHGNLSTILSATTTTATTATSTSPTRSKKSSQAEVPANGTNRKTSTNSSCFPKCHSISSDSTDPTNKDGLSADCLSRPEQGQNGSHGFNFMTSSTPLPPSFSFWYVDSSGKEVLEKDKAVVTFNDIISVGFLIKCKERDMEGSRVCCSIDTSRTSQDPFVYAFLGNMDAPDRANPPLPTPSWSSSSTPAIAGPLASSLNATKSSGVSISSHVGMSPTEPVLLSSDSEDEIPLQPLSVRVRGKDGRVLSGEASGGGALSSSGRGNTVEKVSRKRRASVERDDSGGDLDGKERLSPARMENLVALDREKAKSFSAATCSEKDGELVEENEMEGDREVICLSSIDAPKGGRGGGGGSVEVAPKESPEDRGHPLFELAPGSFEVVLIVDSSESSASRKSTSQFRGLLLQELGKNGVMFDVRKLNVGDFTWIAREKVTPKPGCLALSSSREVVLEHIIERKRMDDLAGSIIDGRFREQKFRLKHSGVLHPIYLIEEHGEVAHLKIDHGILNQAIANTQIIDGLFVKRTKDIRGSVAYLTIMTRSLQFAYAGKTIQAYPCEAIAELTKKRHTSFCVSNELAANVVCAMEFTRFNEASIKNKVLTVSEMFARQLMQLPGMSAEKASVVLDKYPTLSHLREGYSKCEREDERVTLIQDLRSGCNNRRFGKALSQLLYSLYFKKT